MIIFIIILYITFYAYMDIMVLYHREVLEETSPCQMLKRNETIYSNKMQACIFFCSPLSVQPELISC